MIRIVSFSLSFLFMLAICSTSSFAAESEAATAESIVDAAATSDAQGTVSWENLKSRIQTGNLSTMALAESIESLDAIDYEIMRQDLLDQLNSLAQLKFYIGMSGGTATYEGALYDSAKERFEDFKEGKLQQDDADSKRQLQNAANQILMGGESLYLSILSLEATADTATRELSALNRSIEDTQLRATLGMASASELQALELSRSNAETQLQSIHTTIHTQKAQLQALLGEKITGNITLVGQPVLPATALASMDYEASLDAAKLASWSLRSAEKDLEDAKDAFDDAKEKYTPLSYKYDVAEHTWNAAQLTYQSAVQDFETAFRARYDAVFECEQLLEGKKTATAYESSQLDVQKLKYELGMISQSDLYQAQDALATAQADETIAAYNLYASYSSYCWAASHGIVT